MPSHLYMLPNSVHGPEQLMTVMSRVRDADMYWKIQAPTEAGNSLSEAGLLYDAHPEHQPQHETIALSSRCTWTWAIECNRALELLTRGPTISRP